MPTNSTNPDKFRLSSFCVFYKCISPVSRAPKQGQFHLNMSSSALIHSEGDTERVQSTDTGTGPRSPGPWTWVPRLITGTEVHRVPHQDPCQINDRDCQGRALRRVCSGRWSLFLFCALVLHCPAVIQLSSRHAQRLTRHVILPSAGLASPSPEAKTLADPYRMVMCCPAVALRGFAEKLAGSTSSSPP